MTECCWLSNHIDQSLKSVLKALENLLASIFIDKIENTKLQYRAPKLYWMKYLVHTLVHNSLKCAVYCLVSSANHIAYLHVIRQVS